MTADKATTKVARSGLTALLFLVIVGQGGTARALAAADRAVPPVPAHLADRAPLLLESACSEEAEVPSAPPVAAGGALAMLIYREDRLPEPETELVAEATGGVRMLSAAYGGGAGAAGGARTPGWPWRRASLTEFAGITVAAAGTLYSEAAYGKPGRAQWIATNGFDDGIRNALRLHGRSAEEVAGTLGDALMGLLIAEPIVDSFATLGYRDRNWDALWQTSVINLESFTFTSLVSSVLQNSIKRQKPFQRECPDGSCADEQPNRGMPSGHVAFAFTGAGLYCTNHAYQSLYDPATERAICAASLGAAAADGVLRIVADRHYATDVLAGSALGLFSGFLLPRLMHYYWPVGDSQSGRVKSAGDDTLWKLVRLTPQLYAGGAGLNCDLRF